MLHIDENQFAMTSHRTLLERCLQEKLKDKGMIFHKHQIQLSATIGHGMNSNLSDSEQQSLFDIQESQDLSIEHTFILHWEKNW